MFHELGHKLLSITDQNQLKSGKFIQGLFCGIHGYPGAVVTPHGIERNFFLYHLSVSEINTGGGAARIQ
jgi:hypothetical protein